MARIVVAVSLEAWLICHCRGVRMATRGIHGLETTSQNMKGIRESAGDSPTRDHMLRGAAGA
jgi:hypothetical protein